MSDELHVAIEAAKKGAQVALRYFNKGIKAEIKEDNTPVTIADKKTEEAIKQFILSQYPGAQFVGEETGGDVGRDTFWIIDPIDGTRSFLRGIPTWCVIVSLCKNEEIVLTAVYFPLSAALYYAEKGKGAYINSKRMHVSKIGSLEQAFLSFGSIRHFKDKNALIRLIERCGSSRSFEVTYCHCLLAEGKMDVTVDAYGKIWDIAPFKVMIEEAGGKITRMDGSPWDLKGSGAVITNGLLHDEVVRILNEK